MNKFDRRTLLTSSAAFLTPLLLPGSLRTLAAEPPYGGAAKATRVHELYPSQDPELAREMVAVSHFSLAKVTALVESHPTLARASWDWGFGDWETALGGASHMGQREIAQLLIANGAPPTIFSAAMLGQLDVVRAIVAALPGVEQVKGPHGIPLLAHAKAGGEPAAAVAAFLEPLERPENRIALKPLSDEEVKMLCGDYSFGKGPRDRFEVTFSDNLLGIARTGGTRRFLFHRGDYEFYPAGAESVRLRFTIQGGRATGLTVYDPGPVLQAVRK